MKLSVVVGLLAGAGAVVGLVLLANPARVWSLILEAGWWLAVVAAIHMLYILVIAIAWNQVLKGQGMGLPLGQIYQMRWIADAVNALLPFLIAGGEVIRGRLQVERTGADGARVSAVIVAELTARLASLVAFILLGIALLGITGSGAGWGATIGAAAGVVLFLVGYYVAQREGVIHKLGRKLKHHSGGGAWAEIGAEAEKVDDLLPEIYAQKKALAWAAGLHFLAWVIGAIEMLLLLRAIGHAVTPIQAWSFESIGQASRNAGFFLPAALGAQEGGYALAAIAIGLASTIGVAIALMKRVRDIIIGLPALLLWQWSAIRARVHGS